MLLAAQRLALYDAAAGLYLVTRPTLGIRRADPATSVTTGASLAICGLAQIVASRVRFDRAISRYIKPVNGAPMQATTTNTFHKPAMASAARAMP
ncbi:MAG TPA: hypothetical protein VHO07_20835 [Streptosporangiaceae bacterium]|nr:hypothetical protein [Streptosporangiaceae bacterium]